MVAYGGGWALVDHLIFAVVNFTLSLPKIHVDCGANVMSFVLCLGIADLFFATPVLVLTCHGLVRWLLRQEPFTDVGKSAVNALVSTGGGYILDGISVVVRLLTIAVYGWIDATNDASPVASECQGLFGFAITAYVVRLAVLILVLAVGVKWKLYEKTDAVFKPKVVGRYWLNIALF